MDMDLAYANRPFIDGGDDYPAKWQAEAEAFRADRLADTRTRLDLAYGTAAREKMDLFLPVGRPKGVLIFIHGGYWHLFDKSSWSHFTAGALARGWAVAMPSYTLAPEARISQMTTQMVQAVVWAADEVGGPIVISGHSAGGHLAARMLCPDAGLPARVLDRVQKVVPISPLSDLSPLLDTSMKQTLALTPQEARSESPRFCENPHPCDVTVWVGAAERPVFLDQARWLAEAWPTATLQIDPEKHHFNVIDGLLTPDSPLMETLLGPG